MPLRITDIDSVMAAESSSSPFVPHFVARRYSKAGFTPRASSMLRWARQLCVPIGYEATCVASPWVRQALYPNTSQVGFAAPRAQVLCVSSPCPSMGTASSLACHTGRERSEQKQKFGDQLDAFSVKQGTQTHMRNHAC